jgi:uncharacterized protein (TIGR03086 family)
MTVDVNVQVPTSAEEAYAWLTEPARLRRWQVVAGRTDLRVGGEFRWLVAPGHTAVGVVAAVEPMRLSYVWGWEGNDEVPPLSSTVDITLEPSSSGTTVRLVHEGLSDVQAKGHAEGWEHYLQRLKAVTTTGDAGPDIFGEDANAIDAAEASLAVCLRVLRSIGTEHGTAPTPCPKFTVDDLVEHLIGSMTGLAGLAGHPFEAQAAGSPEERVADAGLRSVEAWRQRGLDGTVTAPWGEMPAERGAAIVAVELLVHAWDFARATGVEPAVDDKTAKHVLELVRTIIEPPMRDGEMFAAEVPAGPDASTLERLVAFTGRAA